MWFWFWACPLLSLSSSFIYASRRARRLRQGVQVNLNPTNAPLVKLYQTFGTGFVQFVSGVSNGVAGSSVKVAMHAGGRNDTGTCEGLAGVKCPSGWRGSSVTVRVKVAH